MRAISAIAALRFCAVAGAFVVMAGRGAHAEPGPHWTPPVLQQPQSTESAAQPPASAAAQNSICLMLESAARSHDLPLAFFVRVIWRESRFAPDAIGPVTRSGERARGIAQFMPGTAEERGLLDPFDPIQALPKAAEFLSELRGQFGNLGLAAAAYNAGPRRVREWLDGSGPMPTETRNYVLAITGRSVEEWAQARSGGGEANKRAGQESGENSPPATEAPKESAPPADCPTMVAQLRRAPNQYASQYVMALEQRIGRAAAHPWAVQLAAGFSKDRALSVYAQATSRFAAVIENRDPMIASLILRSRGTRPFYKVSVGVDTRPEANTMCARIQKAGGACLVLRNRA